MDHHHHLKDESIYHSLHQMQSLNPPPFADFPHTLPLPQPDPRVHSTRPQPKPSVDAEVKDCAAARKIQKADREKLRRDRLNEQFLELGSAIDPERPKNDKATILTDTILLMKDLTSQVDKLKAEYTALTDESRESTEHASSPAQAASRSHVLGRQDSKNISSGENKRDKSENSDDVTTDLELKTPGSTADQDLSLGERKSKKSLRKGNNATAGSSCSRCSSSRSVEDSSSNSVVGSTKADDLDQSKN